MFSAEIISVNRHTELFFLPFEARAAGSFILNGSVTVFFFVFFLFFFLFFYNTVSLIS